MERLKVFWGCYTIRYAAHKCFFLIFIENDFLFLYFMEFVAYFYVVTTTFKFLAVLSLYGSVIFFELFLDNGVK